MQHSFTRFLHDPLPPIVRRGKGLKLLFLVALFTCLVHGANAQILYNPVNLSSPGNSTLVNFNNLNNTNQLVNVNTTPYLVSGVPFGGTNISDGLSFSSAGTYAYPNSGTNRAFGIRTDASPPNRRGKYGVIFKNTSGSPIKCLKVKYKAQQWNISTGEADRHPFAVLITATEPPNLDGPGWISHQQLDAVVDKVTGPCPPIGPVTALDGLNAANYKDIEYVISFINPIPTGHLITLRWEMNQIFSSCHQPSLAIDDLELTPYSATPDVSSPDLAVGGTPCNSGLNFTWIAPNGFPIDLIKDYSVRLFSSSNSFSIPIRTMTVPKTETSFFFDLLNFDGVLQYRADIKVNAVTPNGCGDGNVVGTILITPPAAGTTGTFTVTPSTPVCSDGIVNLSYSGPNVQFVEWEKKAPPCFGTYTPAGLTGTSVTAFVNTTTCFRAKVKHTAPFMCTSYSLGLPAYVAPVNVGTLTHTGGNQDYCGSANVFLMLSGTNGNIEWEKQPDCIGNFQPTGITTTIYSFNGLTQTYCYRARVASINDANCKRYSDVVYYRINPPVQVGLTQALRTSICAGDTNRVSVPFFSGDIQWEMALGSCTNNFTNVPNTGPNNTGQQFGYNTGPLTSARCYRAKVSRAGCSDAFSTPLLINVSPGANNVILEGRTSVCSNGVDTFRVRNPQGGATYIWRGFPTGATILTGQGTPHIIVAFNNVPAPSGSLVEVRAEFGSCTNPFAGSLNLNVVRPTNPGTLNPANTTVCGNTNSTTLTITGQEGNILRWESSTDNFQTITSISNPNATLVVANLTETTRYRAIVQSGTCLDIPTRIVTIFANGNGSQPGTVTSNVNNLCGGNNSVQLQLNGFSGRIVRWESSPAANNFSTVTGTINNVNSFLNVNNLTESTAYRAIVQAIGCPEERSNTLIINVTPQTVAGTITGTSNVCGGNNTGTLNLGGIVGNVVQWESSTNGFFATNVITNTTSTLTFNNLAAQTQFRALVQNGNCNPAYTPPFTVNVTQNVNAGQLLGAATLCAGTNSGNIQLLGNTGTVVRWESSTVNTFASNVTQITNTTTSQTYSNLTETTFFRAIVNDVNCGTATTQPLAITIVGNGTGGTVTAVNTSVCRNGSTLLTLNGNTAPVQRWQRRIGGCASVNNWEDLNTNVSTLNSGFLNETTCFRAEVSNPNCNVVFSNELQINVTSIVKDNIESDNISCGGANDGEIRLFYSGSTNLEYSLNNGTFQSSSVFENLASGNYTIRVRDAVTGCQAPVEFVTLTQTVSSFAITRADIANVTCETPNSGGVNITVSGGTPDFVYSWSNGATTQDITGVPAGTYSVTATDNNGQGCAVTATYTVTGASGFTVTENVTQVSCSGNNNGVIRLTVSGGNRPVTFTWIDGVTDVNQTGITVRNNLAPGNYSVSINDGSGCVQTRNFNLVAGTNVTLAFNSQDVACQNSGSGFISVTANGGQAPYTYEWSNNQTTAQIFGLNAGTYTVTVTDANGCRVTGSRTINATNGPAAPTANAASNDICVGAPMRLTAVSNEVGVQFQWFETLDGLFAFEVGSSIQVTNNTTGRKTYYVQAVFPNRPTCPSTRVAVNFNVVNGTQAGTVSGTTSICSGQAVTLTLTPATQTVLRWESSANNFATVSTINNQLPTLNVPNLTQTTQFRAVVRDGACPEATSNAHTVTVSQGFNAGIVSGATSVCNGTNSATLTLAQNSNGTTVVRWESSTDNFNQNIVPINNTGLSLSVNNLLTTTAFRAIVQGNGCPFRESAPAVIMVNNCGGIAVTEQSIAFGNVRLGCESLVRNYRVTGVDLTGDITVTAPSGLEIASDEDGPFDNTIVLNENGGQVNASIFVKVSDNATAGNISGNITHTSPNQNTINVAVTANVQVTGTPQFTTNVSVLTFGNVIKDTPSQPKPYTLTATNLSGNAVTLQVNEPYTVSLDVAGPFVNNLTIPVSGCALNEVIYVRFLPTVLNQAIGFVVHSNSGQQFTLQLSGFGILDPNAPQPDIVLDDEWDNQNEVDDTFGPGSGFDFGVDAFSDLQLAIDRTGDNRTLFIAGRDVDGSNVVVDNPMTISGQGDSRTFIEPRGDMTNNYEGDDEGDALNGNFSARHALILQSGKVNVKNLTIDGGSANPCDKKFGVGIITDTRTGREYDDINVENVDIRNVYSAGIQINGTGEDHDVKNVEIVNVCQRFDPDPEVAGDAAGIYSDDPVNIEDVVIQDAGSGVILRNFGGQDEVTSVQRVRIQNVVEDGIQVDMRTNSRGDLRIQGNTINGVGDVGIEAKGLANGAVIGGLNDNLRNTININSNRQNDPGTGIRVTYSDGAVIQNNEINAQGEETGIELFQNDDPNQPVVVRNNNIKRNGTFAQNPDLNEAVGVFMSDNGSYVNAPNAPSYAVMEGNTIDGYNIGIFTNGNGVDGNVFAEVRPDANGVSNTIKNAKEGIRVNGRSRLRVMRNARSIENSDIGVYVYGGELYMEGNALHGNRIAILVEDKPGFTGIATVFDNTFYNNGKNIVNNSADPNNVVNASWNSWGSTNPADIRSKFDGRIDYSPYFNDGRDADNNLNNGWTGIRELVHVDAMSPKTAPAGQIQEAVNNTNVMKVNVVDGIYDENLTVNRSVILTNDGIGSNPIVMNLTMATSNATLTMEQSFDLTGQLTLNGGRVVVANDKVLTVLRGGNTTAGTDNSYVVGNLARQSASTNVTDLYYPIGSNTAFRPATLSVGQSSTSLNTYTGRVVEPNTVVRQLPSGVNSASTTRAHNFRRAGGATITTANIRIATGNGDPFGDNQNTVTFLKDNDGTGNVWSEIGGTTSGNNVASATPFTSLGNFVLGLKPISNNGGGNNGGGNNGGGNNGGGTVSASEITAVSNVTVSSATVRWSIPTCSSPRYEFRYRVTGEMNWTTITNLGSASFFMMGLQSGTRYEISVRSMCPGQAFSDWSTGQINSFTTLQAGSCDGTTPPVPGGMLVSNVTQRTARVSWNLVTSSFGQGTIINFGPINQSPNAWTQEIVCHPSNSFVIPNLRPNTVYGVRIRTNCSNCTTAFNTNDIRSNWSPVVAFSTAGSREETDFNASSAVENLVLYPNPNNGTFSVAFQSAGNEEVIVRILDAKGVLVFDRTLRTTEGANELPVELNGFAEGIYNLMILKGNQVSSTKLQIR